MRGCPHNLTLFFYSRYHEQGHDSAPTLDYRTKPVGIEAPGQAFQRYRLGDGDANEHSVLIVDDGPGILEVYRRLLQAIWPGCRVFQALNEQLALDMLRRVRPSLVLLDLIMPSVDGFGMLEAMQSDERLRAIPVIVLTAQLLTQPDMARLNDQIATILIKGLFTVEETLAHIKQVLDGSKKLSGATRRMVREVMAYIHEHYAEPLTRDALANVASVSSRHLTRCFDAEVGLPPMTYLNRYRIREAMQLLWEAENSITEIARAVGFSNNAYFDVVFRREVGLAPSDYRRCHQAVDHWQL
jgi:YesN/AraC family two-component response regulator